VELSNEREFIAIDVDSRFARANKQTEGVVLECNCYK